VRIQEREDAKKAKQRRKERRLEALVIRSFAFDSI
jgi:hypothetical protein